ncbi:MAG: ATP-binding cassette domain-containing protein [Thermoplasmata archaeon]|nr:ATP-binding cassette domain-containing protein [Thermoplasmata archaeon]
MAMRAAEELGIAHLLDRRSRDLSGGEKQLVAIASSLAVKPRVLIMDEPSSQLDPRGRRRFQNGIEGVRRLHPGITIIQIEQRLECLRFCDQVAILDGGRIVHKGPSSRVLMGDLERFSLKEDPMVGAYRKAVELGFHDGSGVRRDLLRTMGDALRGKLSPVEHGARAGYLSLQLEDVYYRYPGSRGGIRGLNLSLEGIRSLALMGPNGSGKSTLGKTIASLIAPDRGVVKVDGKVFYLFQEPSNMFFAETVEDELGGLDDEKIRLLETLELSGLTEREPQLLSQGEKQRLAMVLALTSGGDLLVLDEPFRSLDGVMIQRVKGLLRKEAAPPHIIITNDPEAASSSDRMLVMKGGRIVGDGPPQEILSDPHMMGELNWPMYGASVIARRSRMGSGGSYHQIKLALDGEVRS